MYVVAGRRGGQEGASDRSIGVAVSTNLRRWRLYPRPVLRPPRPLDNIYVSGAVKTPEGKVAIVFAGQQFPEWAGFYLATASNPLGPFVLYRGGPVYKHSSAAHEFDLVRVDLPQFRYLMLYAGFTPQPKGGPPGDRGYLLYSNDLIHWSSHQSNPVFGPQTADDWDAVHVRPRSLTKIGDTWYLWYEGCNRWRPPGAAVDAWWDTVGLARSKDLVHWEYYPRNPVLTAVGNSPFQFDNKWVGWPRMVVKAGVCYVFYAGGSPARSGGVSVGCRTLAVRRLTDWSGEGGRTYSLLR
jgi:predicted GH43/DUF377 family glycosyl hydrolase